MRTEVIVPNCKILFRHLPGGTEGHESAIRFSRTNICEEGVHIII